MLLHSETKEIQEQFGRYCQSGILTDPLKGAEQDRLPTYRRLVINVIVDTLSSAYPLTKKLLGEEGFKKLCLDFFANHACQEAQVFRMTRELFDFVAANNRPELTGIFPFLYDLMLFEWTEMEMYMMEDVVVETVKKDGNWLRDVIQLNPESRLLQFKYPVFKKKPNELSREDKDQYYCFAFRQPESGKIIFLDVSPLVAIILSSIADGHSLKVIFSQLSDSGVVLIEEQKRQVIDFLVQEKEHGLLLGFVH